MRPPPPREAEVEARFGPARPAAPVAGGHVARAPRVEGVGERIFPRYRPAAPAGLTPAPPAEWGRPLARLPALPAPADAEGPAPAHGGLWSGNVPAAQPNVLAAQPNVPAAQPNVLAAQPAVRATGAGEPALADPAAYPGHREVDLAGSGPLGGFDAALQPARHDAWPLRPGYREVRRGVHPPYDLPVHVNLFGGAYVSQTAATLRRVLAAS